MGEQTLEFELLTCINMLNKKKKKKIMCYNYVRKDYGHGFVGDMKFTIKGRPRSRLF